MTTILEMINITKTFPGITALDNVSLILRKEEVHCILGENGAGKTTLMNILYGLYQMDQGEIHIKGKRVSIRSPRDALDRGIGMVHQFSSLIPGLTVLENIILGCEPSRGPFIDRRRGEEEIGRIMDKFRLEINLALKEEALSVGEKQKVEILKALYRGVNILIMDEPTALLPPQEKEELIKALQETVESGEISAILFITHKLPEVMAISDRVTILRRGKVVDVLNTQETNMVDLTRKMVGREILFDTSKSATKANLMLEVRNLHAVNEGGSLALQGVSLDIREGEILGIAGVSGSGQQELVEVIAGIRTATIGLILVKGKDITNLSPEQVRERGVGYIPEDRWQRGILPDLTIYENVVLGVHSKQPFAQPFGPMNKLLVTNDEAIKDYTRRLVTEYGIETPDLEFQVGKLSGGNIQRIIIARELSRKPDLLLADKPTAGLDVSSQRHLRQQLMCLKERGSAILLISEDLDEIFMMSDRIAVMYEGSIISLLLAKDATKEEVGALMLGRT